jgi:hypothetical protein
MIVERERRIIDPDSAHSAHGAPLLRLRARFDVPLPPTPSTATPSTPPALPTPRPELAEPDSPPTPSTLPPLPPVRAEPAAESWPCWFSRWPDRFPDHRRRWRSIHGVVLCGICAPPARPDLVAEWLTP